MPSIQEQLDEVDKMLRAFTMPPELARTIEKGEEAKREAARRRAELEAERDALREAQRTQVTLSDYEKRRQEREAEEAAVAKAQAALCEVVDAHVSNFDDLIRYLRYAAKAVVADLQTNDSMARAAAPLGNGRRPDILSPMQRQVDISLLWLAVLKAELGPENRHRLGTLEFPSSIDARWRPGADWVGDEKARMQRHILPLAQE